MGRFCLHYMRKCACPSLIAIDFATNSSLPHSLALLHQRQALAPQLAHTFEAKVLIDISAKEPFRQDVLHFPPRGRHWPLHTSHVWDPPGSGKLEAFPYITRSRFLLERRNQITREAYGLTRETSSELEGCRGPRETYTSLE